MKKLSIALAATFALSTAAPVVAAEIDLAPAPMTCMDEVEARYGADNVPHAILLAPLYVTHAVLCHVFYKNG